MARIFPSNTVPGARAPSLPVAARRAVTSPPAPGPRPTFPSVITPAKPVGVPILMHDQVTVPPGGEQPMESKAFLNTRDKPVGIHVMNLLLTAAGDTVLGQYFFGGTIALQIALTRKSGKTLPITRGYVPAWCLCRSTNRGADVYGGTSSSAIAALEWRFSTPIVLDPGDMLTVQVKHTGVVNLTADVDVSFGGSDAPDFRPRRLPYATHWQSNDFEYTSVAQESSPTDALLNDTGTDLVVERIIGRSAQFMNTGALEVFSDYRAMPYMTTRFGIGQNRPILRDFTPFLAAFGTEAAIETAFILSPQDYVTAEVKHVAGPAAGVYTYYRDRAMISLVGNRRI